MTHLDYSNQQKFHRYEYMILFSHGSTRYKNSDFYEIYKNRNTKFISTVYLPNKNIQITEIGIYVIRTF